MEITCSCRWQVIECLTHCGMPQPVAVIRQTIRDLLFRDAEICGGGIVIRRRFWRRFAKQGCRPLSAGQHVCELSARQTAESEAKHICAGFP